MARFLRTQVSDLMRQIGVIPVFYHGKVDETIQIVDACYRGGARAIEFTNRGDFAHEVFTALSHHVRSTYTDLALGIGSIVDSGTTSLYLQLGADFIVSASLREDVALTCNRRKVLYAPGCGSLTEIGRAEELGCDIIKLFPGGTYGPGFVKAIRGPQPWTSIMPTGGVDITEANLTSWFKAGVSCVGIGSALVTKEIIKDQDWSLLQSRMGDVVGTVKRIRS